MRFTSLIFVATIVALPAAASALPLVPKVYVGGEVGRGTRDVRAIGQKDRGVDYGAYVGVELPTMPFGYLAVEANAGSSDGKTSSVIGSSAAAIRTERDAKWNWSGTVRAGVNFIPGLAAYGLAGYGEEKADVRVTRLGPNISTTGSQTFGGLIYGGGARFTMSGGLGVRAEYRKRLTDDRYDPEQVMAGVYYRF